MLPDSDFPRWLAGTAIGQHKSVSVWFSEREGGIVIPLEDLSLVTLDALYWTRPGFRYLFGVELREETLVPWYQDLLEYIGTRDIISAVTKRG